MFHSLQRVTDTNLERAKCTSSKKPLSQAPPISIEATTVVPRNQSTPEISEANECSYLEIEPDLKHCGMFGDPHLRTFSDRFYTCSVARSWHLIDNNYMVVMATNVPVREGSEATVTTKVCIQ